LFAARALKAVAYQSWSVAADMFRSAASSKNAKPVAALDRFGGANDGRDVASWGRLGNLTEPQRLALDAMSERAPPFPKDDPLLARYCCCNHYREKAGADEDAPPHHMRNMFLLRLLRARDFVLEDAETLLRSVVAWRQQNKPWAIPPADVHSPQASFHVYDTGARDAADRPVLYAVQRHMRRAHLEAPAFQRAAIAFLEAVAMNMSPDQDQFVVLYDFEGFSPVRHVPLGAIQGMFRVLQDAYPETLARAYMLPNYPFSFYATFSVVRKFIEPFTAAKLEFLSEETFVEDLNTRVGSAALPTWLGGENEAFTLREP
jgi:CRAL/TRIO domain